MYLYMCIYMHMYNPLGLLRLVGSSNSQVSFAGYSLFYIALLQKRPIILRGLLIAHVVLSNMNCSPIFRCTNIYTHTHYTRICLNMYMYMFIYKYMYVYIHFYVFMYTHTHKHTHTHAGKYTHTRTHTNT